MIRWPGKVPAGKVENGIISGLDWFPTFVAAAGNPNIADELKKGKQIGGTTYKVHLDGYNQMDMITGKGPSKRHEIFYFAESELGAVRIDDYKYRFIDQPGGWLGDKIKLDVPYLTNLRLDPFERTGWPDTAPKTGRSNTSTGSTTSSGASCSSSRKWGSWPDRDRVPADAEGRELQSRCREGENRGSPGGNRQVRSVRLIVTAGGSQWAARPRRRSRRHHPRGRSTPINQTLVNDLAGGGFIAQQRNVVLVGGTGTGNTHQAIAIARSCIATIPTAASTTWSISSTGSRRRDP